MNEKERLLVVDDEPRIGELLADLLTSEGYSVDTSLTGDKALEMLEAEHYDMVISDLKMPGIDGFELIRTIHDKHKEILTVIMTGYATVDTAVEALKHGADDYLTKPFDVDELRKVVGRLLESRRLARENRELFEQVEKSKQDRPLGTTEPASAQALRDLEKKTQQMQALAEINRTITSFLDIEHVLGTCLGLLNQQLNVTRSSIMLVEGSGTHLVVRAVEGGDRNIIGERQRMGERISGWVAKRKEPLLVEDIGQHHHFRPDRSRYQSRSLLSAPIIYQGRLMGVINLTDKVDDASMTEDDKKFLETVSGQLAVAIENARLYSELKNNSLSAVSALAQSMEARDSFTAGHSERVAEHSVRIAEQMGLSDESRNLLQSAAQLHDIGKIGISEIILCKPDSLDTGEKLVVRTHPEVGERIVHSLGFLDKAGTIVRHHHEHWDGSGYPDGLRGEEIPFITRIMSMADAYDAMTCERPYRAARTPEEAVREIEDCSGAQFDPQMVEAFKRATAPSAPPAPQAT